MSPPNKINDIINAPSGGRPGADGRMRPALPRSPFGAAPVGSAGDGVRFNPDRIQDLGTRLVRAVGRCLTEARSDLNGSPREVEAGSFTTFCAHLAHAYVQAVEYADQDLMMKERALLEVDGKLRETARILREVEKKNTVKAG
ncbi:hypothetical protein [Spirillospora albida]|uniref:hypothetical protein n=1 Tax=Spirillospora albida TaxID=58123 RepID=UPI0004C0D5AA|nr:hypothetical protein [Spirillospora albida]